MRFDEADGFLYLSDSLGYTPFSEENFSIFKSAQTILYAKFNLQQFKPKHKTQAVRTLFTNKFQSRRSQVLNNSSHCIPNIYFKNFI